jgi:hypothetical protein
LRAVGVGPRIGHGKKTRLGVPVLEILIREFLAVDGLSTRTAIPPNQTLFWPAKREGGSVLSTGEISSLEHESGNDTVEGAAFVSLSPTSITTHARKWWEGKDT